MKTNLYPKWSNPFLMLFCISFLSINLLKAQTTQTTINGWNASVHLPWDYDANPTKSYPTIIFFPGLGEVGTNYNALVNNGPSKYILQGWNGNVKIGADSIKFIVISLQPPSAYPSESVMNTRIQTLKSTYRIDATKLHLTGLSHGGWCSTTFVTGDAAAGPFTYASQVRTVVEVQGVRPDDNAPYPNLFDNFANSGGRLLGFEQANDFRDIQTRVNRMNAAKANAGIYVQTNFGGGAHCCWEQFYGGYGNEPQKFMLDGINQNMYEWMARNSLAPVVDAGIDQDITLPTNATTLSGTAITPVGSIKSYNWVKIAGPAQFNIANPANPTTTLTNLTPGTYKFVLTATDNFGSVGKDTIVITEIPSGVLPINLLAFTVKSLGQQNQIEWKASIESNIDYFEIEKGPTATDFKNIGKIDANFLSTSDYNFIDAMPFAGLNYYRIVMVDKNARKVYSKSMAVKSKNNTSFNVKNIMIQSEKNEVAFQISSTEHQMANVFITDQSGRVVMNATILLQKGENNITESINNLVKGIYYFKLFTADEMLVKNVYNLN
jgi:hypothetical protein